MIEKRFTLTFDDRIVDNQTGVIHDVHSGYDVATDLAELLNALHEENEQLNEKNQKLNEELCILQIDLCKTKSYEQLEKENKRLKKRNEQLKQELKSIEDGFEFSCTENHTEFNKDKLIVKDTHTKIHLDGGNLFIKVHIPQFDEFYRFKYTITGKRLMREFIENYNPKGDVE